MKKTFLSAILIITAAVLSLIICSCGGKTPENGTTASPTTAQQYIGTVPSGVDLFDDETDKVSDGQTVAPNEPYDSGDSGNNNGDNTTAASGNSSVTVSKSTDKASVANQTVKATTAKATAAKATTAKATAAKATTAKATAAKATTAAKTEKANVYDPAMPDIF